MSKRSITYTKPEEPNFLKRLKQQAGYKEGPTVDTKREDLGPAEDLSESEDEQPTVVVLNEGDLTAEEASRERDRLEREAAEVKADLNSRILFKPPEKKTAGGKKAGQGEKEKSKKKSKSLLSFDEEEEDDC